MRCKTIFTAELSNIDSRTSAGAGCFEVRLDERGERAQLGGLCTEALTSHPARYEGRATAAFGGNVLQKLDFVFVPKPEAETQSTLRNRNAYQVARHVKIGRRSFSARSLEATHPGPTA